MTNLLIVGGAGYIGSNMAWYCHDLGINVVILDDLYSGQQQWLPQNAVFYQGCLGDKALVQQILIEHEIDVVMHLAAFIEVGESMREPAKYYQNNVVKTLSLLDAMMAVNVKQFLFSSTAAVYGIPVYTPIDTKHPTQPINPYGRSKWFIEQVLADYACAYDCRYVSLRYFNACGADPQGRTGECHNPETHLIPIILQAANGRRDKVTIFGDDYPTEDGSCVRDYIHVHDLCQAHWLAVQHLTNGGGSATYNLGNGNGYSVKQIISSVQQVTGKMLKIEVSNRRLGDPPILIADASAIKQDWDWQPQYHSINTIIEHAWQWELSCNR